MDIEPDRLVVINDGEEVMTRMGYATAAEVMPIRYETGRTRDGRILWSDGTIG
ncbi:MAG TPA: hypothetical protein VEA41_22615 [Salinarimonas sp.]|nr:hypothetical protein [Salinarimonas sp.]